MISLVTTVLAAVLLYCVFNFTTKPTLKLPPRPLGVPLIGNALAVWGRPYITYSNWQKQLGDIFMVRFGPIRVLVLGSGKLIKECFQNPIFNGRPAEWSAILLTQGRNGLLTTEGPVWEEQRRFTARVLRNFGLGKKSMESIIMHEVEEFLRGLKIQEGQSIDMKNRFELAVTNSLWAIVASKRFQHDDTDKLELLRKLYKVFGQPTVTAITLLIAPRLLKVAPGLLGLNYTNKIAEDYHAFLRVEVEEHRKSLPTDGVPRDFIDAYLMEINKTQDPSSSFYKTAGMKNLLAIIAEFFFGATETTSLTLSWAFLYIVTHPNVQDKLRKEIDALFPERSANTTISLIDRPRLPFCEATVLEIARKSSIVVTGVMHSTLEDTQFHGYDIPKRTWIMPNVYAVNHDPEIWGDPESFRPERFLTSDEQRVVKNPNFVSFSQGKRSCLGEQLAKDEIFLFITNIFYRFNIVPDPLKAFPSLEPKEGFLLQPQDYSIVARQRVTI